MKKGNRTESPSQLHEVEQKVALQGDAEDQLARIVAFLRSEAKTRELHEVERSLFQQLLELGLTLLMGFLVEKGTGKQKGPVNRNDSKLPYHSTKPATYLSIFGRVEIERAYYWKEGQEGYFPLDAELNLPESRYSYLLQEWGELIGVGQSFDKVTEQLEKLLRIKFWKQGVQKVAGAAARDVQAFYEQKEPPPKEEEGKILVAAVDGKGVPIRREEPREQKLRLGRGEKPNKKKEAVVSAVYTIDRKRRKPEDILREIDERGVVVKPKKRRWKRPKPRHKRVRATLEGKDAAFEEVRREMEERDPTGRKQRVALTDGAEALQNKVEEYLSGRSGIVLILDIMHVLGYLWEASYAFHKEGSREAAKWVMDKLGLLLEGKVGYVVGGLRQSIAKRNFKGTKRQRVEKAIKYMERNRDYMAYDVYLRRGYPIGSGAAEGACRHLVKDRMEGTGMRWTREGAQAILELRSVEINGDWETFWGYHTATEKERLYEAHCAARNADESRKAVA
jgi:hypothetical protein